MREIVRNASEQNLGNAFFSVGRGCTQAFLILELCHFQFPHSPTTSSPPKTRQRPQQLIHSQTLHPGKYDSFAATENSAVKRLPQVVATEVPVCSNVAV